MPAQSTFSVVLDGSNDYVALAFSTLQQFGTGAFSIAGWIKRTITGAREDLYSTASGDINVTLYIDASDHLNLFTRDASSTTVTAASSGTIGSGTWTHIAATRDGSGNLKLYLNGSADGTGSGSAINVSTSGFTLIGCNAGTVLFFNGRLDHWAEWKGTELSAGDIGGLAAGTTTVDSLSPSGYWKFEEGTGTDINDASGNGNNGTLTNGPTWSSDVPSQLAAASFVGEEEGLTCTVGYWW